jgi:hypothetical protein
MYSRIRSGPLREHLERVLRRQRHDREHAIEEVVGDLGVEEVRHAVDEDPPRPPAERLVEARLVHQEPEARPARLRVAVAHVRVVEPDVLALAIAIACSRGANVSA